MARPLPPSATNAFNFGDPKAAFAFIKRQAKQENWHMLPEHRLNQYLDVMPSLIRQIELRSKRGSLSEAEQILLRLSRTDKVRRDGWDNITQNDLDSLKRNKTPSDKPQDELATKAAIILFVLINEAQNRWTDSSKNEIDALDKEIHALIQRIKIEKPDESDRTALENTLRGLRTIKFSLTTWKDMTEKIIRDCAQGHNLAIASFIDLAERNGHPNNLSDFLKSIKPLEKPTEKEFWGAVPDITTLATEETSDDARNVVIQLARLKANAADAAEADVESLFRPLPMCDLEASGLSVDDKLKACEAKKRRIYGEHTAEQLHAIMKACVEIGKQAPLRQVQPPSSDNALLECIPADQ